MYIKHTHYLETPEHIKQEIKRKRKILSTETKLSNQVIESLVVRYNKINTKPYMDSPILF